MFQKDSFIFLLHLQMVIYYDEEFNCSQNARQQKKNQINNDIKVIMNKSTNKPKIKQIELHLQNKCCEYLKTNYKNCLFTGVPAGYNKPNNKYRLMNVRKGIPDMLIFDKVGEYNGMAIEFKRNKYLADKCQNDSNNEQNKTLYQMRQRGWKTCVIYSYEMFKSEVNKYMNSKKKVEHKCEIDILKDKCVQYIKEIYPDIETKLQGETFLITKETHTYKGMMIEFIDNKKKALQCSNDENNIKNVKLRKYLKLGWKVSLIYSYEIFINKISKYLDVLPST